MSFTFAPWRLIKQNNLFDLAHFVDLAFKEDIGSGDHSSRSCFSSEDTAEAIMIAKEAGVIAGLEVAKVVFAHHDPNLKVACFRNDGDEVSVGDQVLSVSGSTISILTTERLVLNIMQRMSGVATTTRKYVDEIKGTRSKVLDTRKTTPLMRWFEKQAVKIGGGENHRFGLYDMIMIKDNHVDGAGGIKNAVVATKQYQQANGLDLKVELEVRSIDELEEALTCDDIDRVMLDNFSPADTKEAVDLVQGRIELESSGGITLDTIRSYAETGVDYISVGALTHSVKSLDLSLKIKK